MDNFSECDPLLSRYFEGSITPEELGKLEAFLLSNDKCARHIADWCVMHRHVGELLTEDQLHRLMDRFTTGSLALRQEITKAASGSNRPVKAGDNNLYLGAIRYKLALAFLASAALLLVAASLWVWRSPGEESSIAPSLQASREEQSPEKPAVRLATLTLLTDAMWSKGATRFNHGDLLLQGSRIALDAGMAKVTFDCGAEIVLEGPCEFVAYKPMVGYLKFGKITADVPRRAFAFAILSPKIDFVDLGTSFGLSVGAQGDTELHVFRGEVLCSRADSAEQDRGTVYHVTQNNAVEFAHAKGGPNDIAMNEKQFSEHFTLRRGENSQSTLVPESNLALWLSADSGVSTDASQRVISWRDILYGENHSGEDAIQADDAARPSLAQDAIAGRPAIRFNGTSDYLLTTPLATTDDQTVALVCQFSSSAMGKSRRWGGQILNYDGPPSRYLSDTLEPGVLQIGEPLLEGQFKPTFLTAQVFAGFIGSATVESGRVDGALVGIDAPVVLTYRYDLGAGRATLAINGKPFSETRAFAPQAITSRKIIGRHAWMQNFFHGDLAELMIYNKALTPDELNKLTGYLAEKYSIRLSSHDGPAR
jgi:hypothetical protein